MVPSTVRSATDTVIRGWRTGSRLCPLGTIIVTGTRCECVPGAAPWNLAACLGRVGLGLSVVGVHWGRPFLLWPQPC